jgi:LPXTG-motif cell wall-anchored protein
LKKIKLFVLIITLSIVFILETSNSIAGSHLTTDEIKSVHMTKIEGINNDYLNTCRFYLKGSPSNKVFHNFFKAENWQEIVFEGNKEVEDVTRITIFCTAETKAGKYIAFGNTYYLQEGENVFLLKEHSFEMKFTFMVELNSVTPTPTTTVTPTPTSIITPTPTNTITPTATVTPSITPTITPTLVTNDPVTFLPSNEPDVTNVPSKPITNNKNLPQTGEGNHVFILIVGGCIILLGLLFIVSKVIKR